MRRNGRFDMTGVLAGAALVVLAVAALLYYGLPDDAAEMKTVDGSRSEGRMTPSSDSNAEGERGESGRVAERRSSGNAEQREQPVDEDERNRRRFNWVPDASLEDGPHEEAPPQIDLEFVRPEDK